MTSWLETGNSWTFFYVVRIRTQNIKNILGQTNPALSSVRVLDRVAARQTISLLCPLTSWNGRPLQSRLCWVSVGIRARIFKLLRSPRIDSKDYIPPAYVAWRAGTTTLFLTRFLAPLNCSKIPAHPPLTHTHTSPPMQAGILKHYAKTTLHWSPSSSVRKKLKDCFSSSQICFEKCFDDAVNRGRKPANLTVYIKPKQVSRSDLLFTYFFAIGNLS